MTRDNDHEQNPNKPADVIRDSNLKATLWRNEGEKGPYYATEFARTYTDDEGKPRDTSSFIGADLLRLSELARKAYDRTNALRRAEFRQRRSDEARTPERPRDQRSR